MMAKRKFQIGDKVFCWTITGRIPGVIEGSELNEADEWTYVIKIGENMLMKDVLEHNLEIRKIFDKPRYKHGDKVTFLAGENEQYEGYIEVVDAYGTLEQSEEPSYDILVKGIKGCMFKHIRESKVIGFSEYIDDFDCPEATDEQLRKAFIMRREINQLRNRLENMENSYEDFVLGTLNYARRKEARLLAINTFLDSNPNANTSDVVEFIINQKDFRDDSAMKIIHE